MRSRGAKTAVIAGLVAGVVALVGEPPAVGNVALGAALVLLPVALFLEVVRGGVTTVKTIRVVALFVCGVLVFADEQVVAYPAAWVTVALLLATGFAEGHLRAVFWAVVVLLSAVAADVAWLLDWEPFDRSEDYEPIGQAPFVLIGLPVLMAIVAAGVGGRWLWRRLSQA